MKDPLQRYDIYGRPIDRDNLFYESLFWLIVFAVFGGGSCAIWYVVFRAIGIVV